MHRNYFGGRLQSSLQSEVALLFRRRKGVGNRKWRSRLKSTSKWRSCDWLGRLLPSIEWRRYMKRYLTWQDFRVTDTPGYLPDPVVHFLKESSEGRKSISWVFWCVSWSSFFPSVCMMSVIPLPHSLVSMLFNCLPSFPHHPSLETKWWYSASVTMLGESSYFFHSIPGHHCIMHGILQ